MAKLVEQPNLDSNLLNIIMRVNLNISGDIVDDSPFVQLCLKIA